MKNLRIALLLLMTAAACIPDKKKDPEPELAGSYQVSQIIVGNQTANLPAGGSSAVVNVTRVGDTQIKIVVDVTENGFTEPTDLGTATIRKGSGRDYDILNVNSTRIGFLNGTDFSLDFVGNNGQRFALTARK
jgi:hypothetical protein